MKRLLQHALSGTTALSLALTFAAVVAAPAHAAFAACKDGEFCIYLNEDGTGKWASFKSGTVDLSVQGLAQAKSAINRTNQVVRLYEQTGLTGPSDPVEASKDADVNRRGFSLANVNGNDWRGKVRSLQVGNWDPKAATQPGSDTPTAAGGYDRCKDGEFCLFSGENGGGGSYATFRAGADDLSKWRLDGTAKSAWNRTGKQVILHSAKGRSGEQKLITSSDKINLKDLGGWDGKVRSVRVGDQQLAAPATTPPAPSTSVAPVAATLKSLTQCTKSARGDSTCARYDQRDGGVVDIEYKSALNSYVATTFQGEVAHKGGTTIAAGGPETRKEGIFRTTVKVGNTFASGKSLCATVKDIKPSNKQWGESCFELSNDDTPKPGMAEPAAVNPAAWRCEPSSFCIYSDYNGAGSYWALTDGADLAAISGLLNDHVLAVKNIDNEDWCLYEDKDQKTKVIVVPAGQSYNLKIADAKRISSVDDDC